MNIFNTKLNLDNKQQFETMRTIKDHYGSSKDWLRHEMGFYINCTSDCDTEFHAFRNNKTPNIVSFSLGHIYK